MELFDLRDLTFSYPNETAPALDGLSFSVEPGEFVLLVGPSGCGKSTLLRQLKTALAPHGIHEGQVLYHGVPLSTVDLRTQTAKIGFVQQSPDNQIVTDKVWHELAFGMESLGYDSGTIRGRVAEMASFFGIEQWYHASVSSLSGGQKQLLNLAAIMVLQPDVLILDEPTSQLDPIAAADFLSTLGRINRELGTTVLLTEHRLDEVFPFASRVLVMDHGKLLFDGTPTASFEALKAQNHPMLRAMPAPMRIWSSVESLLPCPITVSDGRTFLTQFAEDHALGILPHHPQPTAKAASVLTAKEVWFRYEKTGHDIVRGLSLQLFPGELFCLMGGNGSGKSTTLSLLTGERSPYRGTVAVAGKRLAALPQNPQSLFLKHTLLEDLQEMLPAKAPDRDSKINQIVVLCNLGGLLHRHPYDLSGGEQQRAALAKVLLTAPDILLLDEPTKGLDAEFKQSFAAILRSLTAQGVAILMVSHDVEFCAEHADRCALFFDGAIVAEDAPTPFFSGKSFYTTAANRMARHLLPHAVTAADVIVACGGTLPPPPEKREPPPAPPAPPQKKHGAPLPRWRKLLAFLSAAVFLGSFLYSLSTVNLTDLFTAENYRGPAGDYTVIYGILILSLVCFALCISRKPETQPNRLVRGKLTKRTIVSLCLSLLAIPLTILLGIYVLEDRKYYVVSLLILAETLLPFFLAFEGRKPQARELVVLAVLCALGVAGRAAFVAVPAFKPVTALVIISGVAFGGEAGFLVGAMTMFASNMLFGQGPWTPWQMFAMGVIGLLSGIMFRKGLLRRDRLSLSVFGAVVTMLIYGGIMNPASVLMFQPNPDLSMFLTAYLTGVPVDLVHAAASVLFLWMLSAPMLQKLDRIKEKYGLMEGEQP